MEMLGFIVAFVLLMAYLGWGVFTLRLRYVHHHEMSLAAEGVTLGGVMLFYAVDLMLFKSWMVKTPVLFAFTLLGLIVSGAALYGPMLVSLLSQLMVDLVTSRDHTELQVPRYGPAEALERQGDFVGAASEYMVIARIFPKDPTAPLRAGHNLALASQPEQAVEWLERGSVLVTEAEKALRITNRLCSLYTKELDQPEQAECALEAFLERFPDTSHTDAIERRIERLRHPVEHEPVTSGPPIETRRPPSLNALHADESAPVAESEPPTTPAIAEELRPPSLSALRKGEDRGGEKQEDNSSESEDSTDDPRPPLLGSAR